MARPDVALQESTRERTRHVLSLGVALPLLLYGATTLGYDASYSKLFYNKVWFLYQYRHGIYRYRVLGTEAVLLAGAVLHALGADATTRAVAVARGGSEWDLFTAFVVVNGAAVVALTLLLYVVTARRRAWVVPYLVIVAFVIASAYVVTPYDDLSYVFLAAAVLIGLLQRRWSWPICFVLSVLGTATRESFLVGVAALFAALLARPGGWRRLGGPSTQPGDRLAASAWAMAIGSIGTYAALRIVMTAGPGGSVFWRPVSIRSDWTQSSAVAFVLVLLGAFVLIAELPSFPPENGVARTWYRPRGLAPVAAVAPVPGGGLHRWHLVRGTTAPSPVGHLPLPVAMVGRLGARGRRHADPPRGWRPALPRTRSIRSAPPRNRLSPRGSGPGEAASSRLGRETTVRLRERPTGVRWCPDISIAWLNVRPSGTRARQRTSYHS